MWGPKTLGAPALRYAPLRNIPTKPLALGLPRLPGSLGAPFSFPDTSGRSSALKSRGTGGPQRTPPAGFLGQAGPGAIVSSSPCSQNVALGTAVYVYVGQEAPWAPQRGVPDCRAPIGGPVGVQQRGYFSLPGPLKLQDVVKLPLLQRNPREKIIEIWLSHLLWNPLRHATVLTGPQYEGLESKYVFSFIFYSLFMP